ncbi:MAG: hypothetical protein P1U63_12685 [Coxiellaceae bacterium]|nr:hypothetical protein [Coxiellaceae bacterium]
MNISSNSTLFQSPPLPSLADRQYWTSVVLAAGICLGILTASAFVYLLCKRVVKDCHQRVATTPEVAMTSLQLRI